MRGTKTLKRGLRWLRSRYVHGGLILLYHRVVASDEPDPFALCVTAGRFEEQLAFLREWANPMPLAAFSEAALAGDLPPRSVAVTFDDGYVDNLTRARPLLEKYGIPATVFVASGYLGQTFWWDDLASLVLEPRRMPERLRLTVNGRHQEWTTGQATSPARARLFYSLHQLLRPLEAEERAKVMAQLGGGSGDEDRDTEDRDTEDRDTEDRDRRALRPEEVSELGDSDLLEIGAHTISHPILAMIPEEQQRHEIRQSRRDLETISGRPVTSFAYPYGLPADYGTDTLRLVREAGFERACANIVDVVSAASDAFQLPRYWVRNGSGESLARRLKRWLPRY